MKSIHYLLLFLLATTFVSCDTKSKYNLQVKFPEGQNLKIGADVKSRDVAIGSVSSIELFGSDGVIVELEIDPKYKVPKDSKVKMHVENLFIGEKFINIEFSESAEFWENNDTLIGIPAGLFDFNLEDMGLNDLEGLNMEDINGILEEIDLTEFQEQLQNINIEDFEGNMQDLYKEFQDELEKMDPEELEKMKKQMNEALEKSKQK